jgi:phosphatidylinositol alpha-mannosyltransferase
MFGTFAFDARFGTVFAVVWIKMKIAHVCPYDIDRPGGVQAHILAIAGALQSLGHSVTIMAPNISGRGIERLENGVKVARFGQARSISLGDTSFEVSIAFGHEKDALKRYLIQEAFEVIHYHTIWTPIFAFQVFRMSCCPAVATFHDTPADTKEGWVLRGLFRGLSRVLLPRMQAIITPSETPQAHLVVPPGRSILTIPPCTDLRRFADVAVDGSASLGGPVKILFLGRLEPRKGTLVLLQAFNLIKKERVAAELIIAGKGPDEAVLHEYAFRHAIRDVTFLGGVEENQKLTLFQSADIFCAPSLHGESFGIVIAEAMASGKPVVAAANAGYRTILTGEAAAFLTPPGDAAALASALKRLVLQPQLRQQLGCWGRANAMQYDCRTQAPRFVRIYQDAIAGSTKGAY